MDLGSKLLIKISVVQFVPTKDVTILPSDKYIMLSYPILGYYDIMKDYLPRY